MQTPMRRVLFVIEFLQRLLVEAVTIVFVELPVDRLGACCVESILEGRVHRVREYDLVARLACVFRCEPEAGIDSLYDLNIVWCDADLVESDDLLSHCRLRGCVGVVEYVLRFDGVAESLLDFRCDWEVGGGNPHWNDVGRVRVPLQSRCA